MTDTEKAKKTRQIFIVSDGTAITAETLAHSILTQFPDLHYHQTRIPFVNSVEKAVDTARRINAVEREEGLRPIIFTTFVEPDICLLYTSPSPRDVEESRMPSSA